jgi:transcriptional regulator with XRE-family HTH domain
VWPAPGACRIVPGAMEQAEAVRQRVGRNVRRLRDLKGWTQDELAEKVGNTNRHVGQIERGEVNVTIDYLAKIAESLSTDVAALFFNDTPAPDDPPGAIAIFVTPDELTLCTRLRGVLARVEDLARPTTPDPPDSNS